MDHASGVLKAKHLEILTWSVDVWSVDFRSVWSVDFNPVRESIDVCICRPDGDGVPPGNAGLIVKGSEDPDLVLDKVLMTAAVTLRECHLSRPPTVAFLKTGGCVSPK